MVKLTAKFSFMEQWRQDRLIDILDTLIDYRGKTPNKVDCGIPLITTKIVKMEE